MTVYLVEGYDGSGKSTCAKKVADAIGARYVHFFSEYGVSYDIEPLSVSDDELVEMTKRALDAALAEEGDIVLDRGLITPISALPKERWEEFREYFEKIPCVLVYATLEDTIYRLSLRDEDESDWYDNEFWINQNLAIAEQFDIPIVNSSKTLSPDRSARFMADHFGVHGKMIEHAIAEGKAGMEDGRVEVVDADGLGGDGAGGVCACKEDKVDCVLVYPYLEDANWKNELRSKDNLALGYLASCAREAGYSVKIIHAEHNKYTPDEIAEMVKSANPAAVGISLTAQRAYPVVREYVKAIEGASDAKIWLGGIFPTAAYREILGEMPTVDICRGEGEEFVVGYLDYATGKRADKDIAGIAYVSEGTDAEDDGGSGGAAASSRIIAEGAPNVIEDLDALPLPAKDFFADMEEEIASGFYYAHISATRGCFGNCSFCSTCALTGTKRRRVRDPYKVVEEMRWLNDEYGIKTFYFVDELFIDKTDKEWTRKFCKAMRESGLDVKFHAETRVDCIDEEILAELKSVGLDNVFVGVESGSVDALRGYRKGHAPKQARRAIEILRKLDITFEIGYIMIDPMISYEQLRENIDWVLDLGTYTKHNLYNKMNLYFGTDMHSQHKDDGDTPFYERKIASYSDERVAMFARLIDIAKDETAGYTEHVNDFIMHNVRTYEFGGYWQDVAEAINAYELPVWVDILLRAYDLAAHPDLVDIGAWEADMSRIARELTWKLHQEIMRAHDDETDGVIERLAGVERRFQPL